MYAVKPQRMLSPRMIDIEPLAYGGGSKPIVYTPKDGLAQPVYSEPQYVYGQNYGVPVPVSSKISYFQKPEYILQPSIVQQPVIKAQSKYVSVKQPDTYQSRSYKIPPPKYNVPNLPYEYTNNRG